VSLAKCRLQNKYSYVKVFAAWAEKFYNERLPLPVSVSLKRKQALLKSNLPAIRLILIR
jgi:hypothetical protein